MKRLMMVFALMFVATPVFGQSTRGRAFLNAPVQSAEEYAQRIKSCRTREEIKKGEKSPFLNLSCEALVNSFNELPQLDDVADKEELSSYVGTLAFLPCPVGHPAEIARVIRDDDVDYFWRGLREGERCLVDLSKNFYVSSAVCGQWIRTEFPYVFTGTAIQPPPATISEGALREMIRQELSEVPKPTPAPPVQLTPPPSGKPNWFKRHKKPLLIGGLIGLAAGATYCAIEGCWLNDNTNTTTVIVNGVHIAR